MPESSFIFTPRLDGGLDTVSVDFLVAPEDCRDILNFRYFEDGILVKRFGSSAYGSSPVQIKEGEVVKAVSGKGRYYYNVSPYKRLIIGAGTKIYRGDDTTGALTAIKSGLTDNAKVNFQQYEKYYLIVNGNNAPMRYDGTEHGTPLSIWNLGIKRPASAPTDAGGGAGGVLTGDFYYRFTYYNKNTMHESHPSATSAKITVIDKQINLAGILTVTDADENEGNTVMYRRIYRIGGGTDDVDTPLTSVWQLVKEITNNTDVAWTDNTKNDNLGLEMGDDDTDFTCPLGNHEPPFGQYIAYLHDAIFLAGCPDDAGKGTNPNTVYPSKCEDGESFPYDYDLNYFIYGYQVGQVSKEKDVITGIKAFQDTIVVFQNTSMWQLLGDDFTSYTIRNIDPEIGMSGQTAVNCDGLLVWWSLEKGIMGWDGGSEIKCLSDDVEPTVLAVDPEKASSAIACYHKKTYRLFLP